MSIERLFVFWWVVVGVYGALEVTPTQGPAQWANWESWSACTKSCDFGDHIRVRSCTDPSPTDNSKSCPGPNEEANQCYRGPCLGPEVKGVVFNGGSYQNYSAHEIPMRYLVLYIHFKPLLSDATLIHRYRGCTADDECDHQVEVKIETNRIRLFIKDSGFHTVSLLTRNTIRLGEWQTLLVQITRRLVILRLDDRKRISTELPVTDTTELNFDATMIVGSNRLLEEGFIGTVLKLRLNFKDLSLFHTPDWVGFGAPVKQKGIELEVTDSAESHSRFLGKYSAKIHFKSMKVLLIKISLYLMNTEGVILFNKGTTPGSYMSLTLHRGALRFCVNLGVKAKCQKAILLQIRRWYYLSIMINKNRGELRVDKGRAIQIRNLGKSYNPEKTLLIGGGGKQDWELISKLTREDKGFDGVINDVFVNGKVLPFKHAVLVDQHGRVNTDGYSISAHVSEVYEAPSSKVSLRCDATLFARRGGLITINWIESDRYITTSDGEKIIPKVPGNPYESALILKANHHHEGIYACIVNHDGFRIITHTFPVIRHAVKLTEFVNGYDYWAIRAVIVLVPILLVTCLIMCCCCCCCRGKANKVKSSTELKPPLPPRGPIISNADEASRLLNTLEKGLSNRHIYKDLQSLVNETSSSTLNKGIIQKSNSTNKVPTIKEDLYETPIIEAIKENKDKDKLDASFADSKDDESEKEDETDDEEEGQDEKGEILEKASRVLSIIGSIDNLKKVCSRLSQEQMNSSQVNLSRSQQEMDVPIGDIIPNSSSRQGLDGSPSRTSSTSPNRMFVPPPQLSNAALEIVDTADNEINVPSSSRLSNLSPPRTSQHDIEEMSYIPAAHLSQDMLEEQLVDEG